MNRLLKGDNEGNVMRDGVSDIQGIPPTVSGVPLPLQSGKTWQCFQRWTVEFAGME